MHQRYLLLVHTVRACCAAAVMMCYAGRSKFSSSTHAREGGCAVIAGNLVHRIGSAFLLCVLVGGDDKTFGIPMRWALLPVPTGT